MPKVRVGVIFGGRSPEHDISVITAQQVISALDIQKYEVIPVYITKEGRWYTGSKLMRLETFTNAQALPRDLVLVYVDTNFGHRVVVDSRLSRWVQGAIPLVIDVGFPAVHGPFGEDGTLQGLLELANIPYVGSGVVGSAVGMDKLVMKAVFQGHGLPILPYLGFSRVQWDRSKEAVMKEIENVLPYPVFVKPANLGSSIAVSRVKDRRSLVDAFELAANYDRRVLVEKGLLNPIEVNCSVMGNDELQVSPCEQPVRDGDFLSFDDKYTHGGKGGGMKGSDRLIPAPIPPEQKVLVQDLAMKAFKACDCRGVARIDFLIDRSSGNVFINEINTTPGSFASYLWQHVGIDFTTLCDTLIDLAMAHFREKAKTLYTIPVSLLRPPLP